MLERNENGVWRVIKPMKHANKDYLEALPRYLNEIDNLFIKAKKKSESEFIFTLLRAEKIENINCDTFKNLKKIFESFSLLKKKIKNDEVVTHLHLFLYGLITEASEPYNIMANLINVIKGDEYEIENFPDITDSNNRQIPQHPLDKANQLKSKAKKLKIKLSFYDEIFDNKLRNAIFHSDYSIDWPDILIKKPLKRYTHSDWMLIINRAIAYFESFLKIYFIHISSYDSSKTFRMRCDFITDKKLSGQKEVEARTIVRTGYGLVGFMDNYSKNDFENGCKPFYWGRFLSYERYLVKQRKVILPRNKIEIINNIIQFFPLKFRSYLVKLANKKLDKI